MPSAGGVRVEAGGSEAEADVRELVRVVRRDSRDGEAAIVGCGCSWRTIFNGRSP